ncbi:unknown [Ruminococcus sp. CAG:382]|nr:unknown [Ruminococcus sp. CAG:382]
MSRLVCPLMKASKSWLYSSYSAIGLVNGYLSKPTAFTVESPVKTTQTSSAAAIYAFAGERSGAYSRRNSLYFSIAMINAPAAKSMSSRTTLKENGGFWLNVIELTVKRLCVSNSKVTECRLPPEVMPKMLSPPGMKRFLPTKTRFMLDASSVL